MTQGTHCSLLANATLAYNKDQCEDFEIRFCCEKNPTSTNKTRNSIWDQLDYQKKLELPKEITDLTNDANGFNISNPSSIGLECKSGIIDDCNESSTMEVLPFSCLGILMFSTNSNQKCGSKCDNEGINRMRISNEDNQPIRSGWTKWTR